MVPFVYFVIAVYIGIRNSEKVLESFVVRHVWTNSGPILLEGSNVIAS